MCKVSIHSLYYFKNSIYWSVKNTIQYELNKVWNSERNYWLNLVQYKKKKKFLKVNFEGLFDKVIYEHRMRYCTFPVEIMEKYGIVKCWRKWTFWNTRNVVGPGVGARFPHLPRLDDLRTSSTYSATCLAYSSASNTAFFPGNGFLWGWRRFWPLRQCREWNDQFRGFQIINDF